MIYAIYQAEDGKLVGTTTDRALLAPAYIIMMRGHAVIERPDEEAGGVWNPATLQFDPRPAGALTPFQFKSRLTAQERIAIRAAAASDPVVADFLDMLGSASEVLTGDPQTIAGVDYMVSVGLLTAERAAEVLA